MNDSESRSVAGMKPFLFIITLILVALGSHVVTVTVSSQTVSCQPVHLGPALPAADQAMLTKVLSQGPCLIEVIQILPVERLTACGSGTWELLYGCYQVVPVPANLKQFVPPDRLTTIAQDGRLVLVTFAVNAQGSLMNVLQPPLTTICHEIAHVEEYILRGNAGHNLAHTITMNQCITRYTSG